MNRAGDAYEEAVESAHNTGDRIYWAVIIVSMAYLIGHVAVAWMRGTL